MSDPNIHAMKVFNMMKEQKILLVEGEKFRISPSFYHILESNFYKMPPATAIIMAIRSFCPEISSTEQGVFAGGVLQILKIANHPLAPAIAENLHQVRDPKTIKDPEKKLDEIMEKIKEDEKLK